MVLYLRKYEEMKIIHSGAEEGEYYNTQHISAGDISRGGTSAFALGERETI
jgi:hypothetical protein